MYQTFHNYRLLDCISVKGVKLLNSCKLNQESTAVKSLT